MQGWEQRRRERQHNRKIVIQIHRQAVSQIDKRKTEVKGAEKEGEGMAKEKFWQEGLV